MPSQPHDTMPLDTGGRLLLDLESYARQRGITTDQAAAELLQFAADAGYAPPARPSATVHSFSKR